MDATPEALEGRAGRVPKTVYDPWHGRCAPRFPARAARWPPPIPPHNMQNVGSTDLLFIALELKPRKRGLAPGRALDEAVAWAGGGAACAGS